MECSKVSVKILGVCFGNSILDRSNWGKSKWNSLIQTVYIGQYMLFQNISKRKLKEYAIFSGAEKSTTWSGHFRLRHSIDFSKKKINSKVIKSNQRKIERSSCCIN